MLNAAILGFIGAIIPGPLLSAFFTEILQEGFKKSLKTVFYAFIAEFSMAYLIILIFSSASLSPTFFSFLSLVGAVVLLWISRGLWKASSMQPESYVRFNFKKVCLLTATNGLFWTYWVSVCLPMAMHLDQTIFWGKFIFLAMIESGWLIGTLLLCFLFSNFRPLLLKGKKVKIAFKIFSLVFVFFALNGIYKTFAAWG